MTADMICPVCNGAIAEGQTECPRCGFRLAGLTEAFKPVGTPSVPGVDPLSPVVAPSEYSLYVAKGPQPGEEFTLDAHKTTIGRDPRCDIFLNDMTVSREHAVITVDGDDVTVQDDDSLNGTWVDGKVVDSAQLHAGSTIQIGTFTMVLQKHLRAE